MPTSRSGRVGSEPTLKDDDAAAPRSHGGSARESDSYIEDLEIVTGIDVIGIEKEWV